jgi:hypothetical protein
MQMSNYKLPKAETLKPLKLPRLPKLPLGLRYSSREPIPAKKKQEVRERARNKCEVCHKKPYCVTLEFHHKNMKNNDNSLSNLQLLCPNHHKQKHASARRKYYRDILGREYYSRLVKRIPEKKSRKGPTKKRAKLRRAKTPLEKIAESLR